MRKQLIIGSLLIISFFLMAQNTVGTYEKQWKKVESLQREDLPQSASEVVDQILQKAIVDKDIQQIVKSLIHKNKYKIAIDQSDNKGLISDLQALVETTNKPSEKALLHTMIAELYRSLYSTSQWMIDQRTTLLDTIPSDMEEWSKNIYFDKIKLHSQLSIKDKEELKKEKTTDYTDIIGLGLNSKNIRPTLYDFVMQSAIESLGEILSSELNDTQIKYIKTNFKQLASPANSFVKLDLDNKENATPLVFDLYCNYLQDLLDRKATDALIYTEINKIQLLQSIAQPSQSELLVAYENSYETYKANDTSVEIIACIVDLLGENSYTIGGNKELDAAYAWIEKGLTNHTKAERIDLLKDKRFELERPILTISNQSIYYPQTAFEIKILHRNLQSLDNTNSLQLLQNVNGEYVPVKNWEAKPVSSKSYVTDSLILNIDKLEAGNYILSYTTDTNKKSLEKVIKDGNTASFSVSALSSFHRAAKDGVYEIFVVDRLSGEPVKGANVHMALELHGQAATNTKKETDIKTDALGLATYNDADLKDKMRAASASLYYKISTANDTCLTEQYLSTYIYDHSNESRSTKSNTINIYSDRNIYRPGQNVYFKTIVSDSNNIVQEKLKLKVLLISAQNNKELADRDVVTNDFGSANGSFTLDQSLTPGAYYIKINETIHHIQVEEYKRPTFEITFDEIEKTYKFGEAVTISGKVKSYSGINLTDVDVQYSISRTSYFPFFYGRPTHFENGNVTSKQDGSFSITFTPTAQENEILARGKYNRNNFLIDVTATDINGESQANNFNLPVSDVSLALVIDMQEQIEKSDKTPITISAQNLKGKAMDTNGKYTIYSVDDNNKEIATLLTANFVTGKQPKLNEQLAKLKSGKYKLEVSAKDSNGKEVIEDKHFVLYAYNDARPPIKTDKWLVKKNTQFDSKHPAEIIFGTSNKDSYVLYQVYNKETIVERKFVKLSNENKLFKITYNPAHGKELIVSFTYIYDNKFYSENIYISKKEELEKDTSLLVAFTTFRDKLRTGQAETWTLSVKDKAGKPAQAELLASMYDKSLDQLYPNQQWRLNKAYTHSSRLAANNFQCNLSNYWREYSISLDIKEPSEKAKPIILDKINWYNYPINVDYYSLQSRSTSISYAPSSTMLAGAVREKNAGSGSIELDEALDLAEVTSETAPVEKVSAKGQLRKNFNETAFFFPQLRTNQAGETVIAFSTPESNTTWRLRVLAHDKNTNTGYEEKTVITQKELMVTPNMPRFIRQGDKASISTKVSNLSDKTIDGTTRIEFFSPINEEIINLNITEAKQAFTLKEGASTSATWVFNVPTDIDVIGCRIVANSANFSDGEQHALAILPNRILVTESMPFDVTEQGTTSFEMSQLLNNKSTTSSNYKLTFEYTNSPAWYAVMALPVLDNPQKENAVEWFASYYVNTLGTSIVKQYPKVAAVIKAWKEKGGSKEELVSKLNQNSELKSILLEETPWLLDAKNEEEQMQRLSLLFDFNNTDNKISTALDKLSELQNYTGSWSWYAGMSGNRSITQYMLMSFTQLQHAGQIEYTDQVKRMQMNALSYLDKELIADYKKATEKGKSPKMNAIPTSLLEHLYLRSFYRDIPIDQEARTAERYFTDIAVKNWTKLNLYEKGLLSVLVRQNGDKALAHKIAKSVREYAKVDSKLGMHWPNIKGQAFLSPSLLGTHTFLMDALKQDGATQKEINNMKQWLVKQKQANKWGATQETIYAISTLLQDAGEWYNTDATTTQIVVGSQTVDTKNSILGTGYSKTVWDASQIEKEMAKVSITTSNTTPSYGALYWQYYEDLTKVQKQAGELNIEKALFKKIKNANGEALVPVSESNSIKIGDKITVRLTIKTDRDMSYIHIKDMRAACLESVQTISGMQWKDRLTYYQTNKDASTNMFIDHLSKGTYVLEYDVYATRLGEYANGITSVQSMYAPEYTSHTAGIKVIIKN